MKATFLRLFFLVPFSICVEAIDKGLIDKKFALAVLKDNPRTNIIISPMLIKQALFKIASVAQGGVKDELFLALGIDSSYKVKEYHKNIEELQRILVRDTDGKVLNCLLVNYTNDIDVIFANNSKIEYGVDVRQVGFNLPKAATDFVNKIVATETLSRIPALINEGEITRQTTLVSVMGTSVKPLWEFPFDHLDSLPMSFRLTNRRVIKIPTMKKVASFTYAKDSDEKYEVIELNLLLPDLYLLIYVPRLRSSMAELLHLMEKDHDYIKKIRKSMNHTSKWLYLPKFKIKSKIDVQKYLKQIGLSELFNSNSTGLSAILKSRDPGVHLGVAKQGIFLDVHEGVMQNIYRELDGGAILPTGEATDMYIDSPFYFTMSMKLGEHYEDFICGAYYGP